MPLPVAGHPAGAVARRSGGDAAYWTAQRMRQAVPVVPPRRGVDALAATPAPPGIPHGTFFDGIPAVGTFFVSTPTGDTTCTGSVVRSPAHNLVLTAGHCADG